MQQEMLENNPEGETTSIGESPGRIRLFHAERTFGEPKEHLPELLKEFCYVTFLHMKINKTYIFTCFLQEWLVGHAWVCEGGNWFCVRPRGPSLYFQQLPLSNSNVSGLCKKPVHCEKMLNSSSESLVSRQAKTTPKRVGTANWGEKGNCIWTQLYQSANQFSKAMHIIQSKS